MELELPEQTLDKLNQLGAPLAEFGVGRRRLNLILVGGIIMVLLGIVLVVATVALAYLAMAHRPHFHALKLILVLGFFGVALVIAGVVWPVRAHRSAGLVLLVYPEGIVRLRGDEFEPIWWEEIVNLKQFRMMKGILGSRCVIHRRNGSEFAFDSSLPRILKLIEIVERETLRLLWPACREAFDKGECSVFGPLRASRQGLEHDKARLAWNVVKDVTIERNGALKITKRSVWSSRWFSAPLGDIPNYHVLLALIKHARAGPVA